MQVEAICTFYSQSTHPSIHSFLHHLFCSNISDFYSSMIFFSAHKPEDHNFNVNYSYLQHTPKPILLTTVNSPTSPPHIILWLNPTDIHFLIPPSSPITSLPSFYLFSSTPHSVSTSVPSPSSLHLLSSTLRASIITINLHLGILAIILPSTVRYRDRLHYLHHDPSPSLALY